MKSPEADPRNLLGHKFGRWTVERDLGLQPIRPGSLERERVFACRCECGAEKRKTPREIRRARSVRCRKCGAALASAATVRHGESDLVRIGGRRIHRRRYRIYRNMLARVRRSGIDVDPRWIGLHGYRNFCADLDPPSRGRTRLVRIDPDRGYWPDNVRLEFRHPEREYLWKGIPHTIGLLASLHDISPSTLRYRLARMPVEDALRCRVQKR